MLLVHGVAAGLLRNRIERTTAVLHLIHSLVTALLNLLKKDGIPYFVCSRDSSLSHLILMFN